MAEHSCITCLCTIFIFLLHAQLLQIVPILLLISTKRILNLSILKFYINPVLLLFKKFTNFTNSFPQSIKIFPNLKHESSYIKYHKSTYINLFKLRHQRHCCNSFNLLILINTAKNCSTDFNLGQK